MEQLQQNENTMFRQPTKNFVGHSNSIITEEVYLKRSNEKQAAILKILDETIQNLK